MQTATYFMFDTLIADLQSPDPPRQDQIRVPPGRPGGDRTESHPIASTAHPGRDPAPTHQDACGYGCRQNRPSPDWCRDHGSRQRLTPKQTRHFHPRRSIWWRLHLWFRKRSGLEPKELRCSLSDNPLIHSSGKLRTFSQFTMSPSALQFTMSPSALAVCGEPICLDRSTYQDNIRMYPSPARRTAALW